ncbi:MAG: IMP dehydrogenase, partial [Bacteroidales bacterium]
MGFEKDKIQLDGYTFDDVLLIPKYSEILPHEVNLSTRFSRNIDLNIPLVSAAMDTVTEAELAIAISRQGGIGVIHKNMSIEEQAKHVKTVKRAENGMIYDPITIEKNATIGKALNLMTEYQIGGIPVVDKDGYLIGIVTNRDLRFEKDYTRPVDDVMSK